MKNKYIFLLILLTATFTNAQIKDPLKAKDFEQQEQWVDSILQKMSVEEKIGQLFMVQAYSNKGEEHKQFISELITKYHVGNLIFMQGTPKKQLLLTNQYQSMAKVPLMIGFDGEWGLDMRLKDTYRFPWNMTLGAIQDCSLIEQVGQRIGEHCKRIGIHMNFAPVVDINTNPSNPIIGNRSFGELKENVVEKSIEFTKGMQSVGVLANAKHFPGHGDTATDSHHTLPVVNFTKQRLDTLELYPFKKQFEAGVASVMTAHLNIPLLESNTKLPSSLSKKVVTTLLQNELGFSGLVITDGLNMKGASNYSSAADINFEAFMAGNDILLIPQEIPATVTYFKQQLNKGTFDEERLNHSVRKILKAKYLVGLHNYQLLSEDNLYQDLHSTADKILDRKLVQKSLTLIKNQNQILPIQNLEKTKIAYVSLGDDKGNSYLKMLQNYTKVDEISDKNLDRLIDKLQKYNLVVVGFHKSNKNPWKSYSFSNKELVWLQEIARNNKVVLDIFASPYSLLQIKTFTNIESIMVSYQNSKLAQELSAQAVFGAFGVNGKLPVSINQKFKAGEGMITQNLHRLQYSFPEDVGISSQKLANIDRRIDTILKEQMAPGGQVLVARNGKVVYHKSFGYHTFKNKQKVKKTDIYDVASLTKILASLPMIMKANEEGYFTMSSQLGELLPSFRGSNKDTVTVKEVLSHVGQLKPWIPFYLKTQDSVTKRNLKKYYRNQCSKKFSVKVANNLYIKNDYKDTIIERIKEAKQLEKPKYRYSDLGYYLFQKFLEKTYKQPLDKLISNKFYNSLGLSRTAYSPLKKFNKNTIVPTELDDYYRNQLLRGYVHDMGAAMQGGVAGHAGLFSNANDIAKIMQLYLNKGVYGAKKYLSSKTIDTFNTRYYASKKIRRGLGFDKPQIDPKETPTCGCVSEQSFGHSGFTGTFTWADPDTQLIYVFLSNRVYPTMANRKLIETSMRTKIQEDIQNAIIQ